MVQLKSFRPINDAATITDNTNDAVIHISEITAAATLNTGAPGTGTNRRAVSSQEQKQRRRKLAIAGKAGSLLVREQQAIAAAKTKQQVYDKTGTTNLLENNNNNINNKHGLQIVNYNNNNNNYNDADDEFKKANHDGNDDSGREPGDFGISKVSEKGVPREPGGVSRMSPEVSRKRERERDTSFIDQKENDSWKVAEMNAQNAAKQDASDYIVNEEAKALGADSQTIANVSSQEAVYTPTSKPAKMAKLTIVSKNSSNNDMTRESRGSSSSISVVVFKHDTGTLATSASFSSAPSSSSTASLAAATAPSDRATVSSDGAQVSQAAVSCSAAYSQAQPLPATPPVATCVRSVPGANHSIYKRDGRDNCGATATPNIDPHTNPDNSPSTNPADDSQTSPATASPIDHDRTATTTTDNDNSTARLRTTSNSRSHGSNSCNSGEHTHNDIIIRSSVSTGLRTNFDLPSRTSTEETREGESETVRADDEASRMGPGGYDIVTKGVLAATNKTLMVTQDSDNSMSTLVHNNSNRSANLDYHHLHQQNYQQHHSNNNNNNDINNGNNNNNISINNNNLQQTQENGIDHLNAFSPLSQGIDNRKSSPMGNNINMTTTHNLTNTEHFEIIWSNLSYKIEPKWYKKVNFLQRFFPGQTVDNHSSANSTTSSSSFGGNNCSQHLQDRTTTTSPGSDLSAAGNSPQRSVTDPIEIFSNLNGTIKSGQVTAVLGPSGAGKTTLLNCLTSKLRKGVSGHINLRGGNGKQLKMCTIPQKDHLLELLTVEENLWFASKIKNPQRGFDHIKNIERIIDLLGLKRCRSAKIKKISGGQYKRVSIAQELLSNPDILVLDEPTSGLDSLTCFKTISMLRDLVELSANNDFMKPMAIIVTIHQPQPKVFNLFHHVYILGNGGRVIYEGPPELSVDTITNVTGLQPFEQSKGPAAPGTVDPASFLIEIASEEYGSDVINALSDYQSHVFRQTHPSSIIGYRKHTRGFDVHDESVNARDNHGFTDDFDSDKSKSPTKLPDIFVPDEKPKQLNDDQSNVDKNNGHQDKQQHYHSNNNSHPQQNKQQNNYIRKCSISGELNKCKSPSSKLNRRRKSTTYNIDDNSNSKKYNSDCDPGCGDSTSDNGSLYMSEQLLYTRVPNHRGRFWSHTATLTHRTLLTIRRDPLLMTSRVLFHLMIPALMGHVYGKATGAANACPHYEPEIDITQIPSLVEGKRIELMLEELHMSIENVSMFFIIMYAFAAAVLALNALSFPLNMQVLLKETRNGWYSMSSYVLAKTLADLPLELTMPCLTMLLVYPMTGQPSSYLQWRMLTICLIMTLCSLIAQTQALIIGALVMNSVQTAVFVSQASQLPWVILAGFTIRIKRLSEPLKVISLTSFYRLGCEAITLTRYGFGICPCDPAEITGEPVRLVGIPDQLRTVAQYWLDSVESSRLNGNNETSLTDGDIETTTSSGAGEATSALIATTTTTSSPPAHRTDIFQHIANQLSYANSYGVNITSCDDVAPDRIRAINLGDSWLVARIWHLFIMLIIMKVLLYYAVKFSIGIRL